jgi:hypothetical protein
MRVVVMATAIQARPPDDEVAAEKEITMRKLTAIAIAAASFLAAVPANSADYRKVDFDTVAISGPIEFGDETKFRTAVSKVTRTQLTDAGVILLVDTPGGNVYAARQIAAGILSARIKGIPTTLVVRAGSVCASSCVVMFAAATTRIVEVGGTKDGKRIPSGALYVHTLAIDGNETEATMAASVELARVMKEVGTPDPVLAKLLLTGTRDGKRLDARDLKSWDNTVLVPFHGSELR